MVISGKNVNTYEDCLIKTKYFVLINAGKVKIKQHRASKKRELSAIKSASFLPVGQSRIQLPVVQSSLLPQCPAAWSSFSKFPCINGNIPSN